MKPACQSCDKGMNSADTTRICRIHGRSIEPGSALARYVERHGCKDFAREPGEDSEESGQPWFRGGWCVTSSTEGRGD